MLINMLLQSLWVVKESRAVYKAASARVTKPNHTLFVLLLLRQLCV
jgi:hypothetical protein